MGDSTINYNGSYNVMNKNLSLPTLLYLSTGSLSFESNIFTFSNPIKCMAASTGAVLTMENIGNSKTVNLSINTGG